MSEKILAIETSTDYGSVAILYGDEILYREVKSSGKHSDSILSMIDALLSEAGLNKAQLDAISFGRGPGSFTGIRLAMSIAQATAFALDIPVIPVSTLQALAQKAWYEHQCNVVLAALDARLHQIYWGCYQKDEKTPIMQLWGEERLQNPEQVEWPKALIASWKGVGSGWDHYSQHLRGQWIADIYPNAYNIAVIARYKYQQHDTLQAVDIKPVYLRNEIAQTSLKDTTKK